MNHVLGCLFVVTMLLVGNTRGACLIDLSGLQHLLHEHEVDIHFTDSLPCVGRPRIFHHYETQAFHGPRLFGFVTGEDELLLLWGYDLAGPAIVCGNNWRDYRPLPGIKPTDMIVSEATGLAILDTQDGTVSDSGRIRIGVSNTDAVAVYDITMRIGDRGSNHSISTVHRFDLSMLNSRQRIRSLGRSAEGGVIAVGDGGLVRRLRVDPEPEEIVLDIDSSENLLCTGDGYAGSADGGIYRIGEQTPRARASGKLRTISSQGAGGDNGLVLEHINGEWNEYDIGDISVCHVDFDADWEGMHVNVIDENFEHHRLILHDFPTKLQVVSPPEFGILLSGDPFAYSGADTLRIVLSLSDREGNYEQPIIEVRNSDTAKVFQWLNSWYLPECESGAYSLNHSSINTAFTKDCILYHGMCYSASFPSRCNEIVCEPTAAFACSASQHWMTGDTAVITVGDDELKIIHAGSTHAGKNKTPDSQLKRAETALSRLRHVMVRGQIPSHVEIYTMKGKRVELPTNRTPLALPQGMYILRVRGGEGSVGRFVVGPGAWR